MDTIKSISYRGIVEFVIPADWVEEYDADGRGVFHGNNNSDPGVLRVSSESWDSKGVSAEHMAASAFPRNNGETTASGFPLAREEFVAEVAGVASSVRIWTIAVPVPPYTLRLVRFSYVIPLSQSSLPEREAEQRLLESSIREAHFSQRPMS